MSQDVDPLWTQEIFSPENWIQNCALLGILQSHFTSTDNNFISLLYKSSPSNMTLLFLVILYKLLRTRLPVFTRQPATVALRAPLNWNTLRTAASPVTDSSWTGGSLFESSSWQHAKQIIFCTLLKDSQRAPTQGADMCSQHNDINLRNCMYIGFPTK